MAFDEVLASRVRKKLAGRKAVVEKKMFGGVAFLLNGNMSVGVHGRIASEKVNVCQRECSSI